MSARSRAAILGGTGAGGLVRQLANPLLALSQRHTRGHSKNSAEGNGAFIFPVDKSVRLSPVIQT